MNLMTRVELKGKALDQLKGNWKQAVLVSFLFCLITGLGGGAWYTLWPTNHFFNFNIISFLYVGTMTYGYCKYFICLKRGESRNLEMLFSGFSSVYWRTVLLMLLIGVFTFLWTLLLVVPGIIALMRYSQAWFIMVDDSNIRPSEAIEKSKQMMDGHKWRYFVLGLSFIWWFLLSCLTLGIGFLWLMPYIQTTVANFYDELKSN